MNTARILIVEDDAILVTHLEQTLIQIGYQVLGWAATGEAAVEMALAQKPDAILMDIRLRSAMTGIQAAAEIHQKLDTPIIYLTAYTDDALLQQAKLTDAYAYLAKPVRDRELRASLEMALYKHVTEKRLQHLNQILRAVRDVNKLITHEPDAQRLLDQACQILLRTRGFRFVWIGQSMGDRLKPLALAGEGQNLLRRIVASATHEQGMQLPGTQAAHTRLLVVCHDMLQDERYAPWREEVEQVHFSSTVAIPILHEESLFGVLSVYSDQANIFGPEELDLLLELAGDIAFGLKAIERESERKRVEQKILESTAELSQRVDDLALINTLNTAINRGDDLHKIVALLADELHRIFNCIGTITAFPNPDNPARTGASTGIRKSLRIEHIEFQSPLVSQIEKLIGASIWSIPLQVPMTGAGQFAQVLRAGTPKAINDADTIKAVMAEYTDNKLLKRLVMPVYKMLGIGSMILIPLISEVEIFGLLEMARTEATTEDDLFRVQSIAGQLTTAIGRRRAEQLLRENEEKFKTLFNTANDAIFTLNHTTFLDCNATTEKIFRCSREQIVGHSPVEFSPERQPDGSLSSPSAKGKIEAAFAGQPQVFEWLHTHLDGTPFHAEVSLNRVFIGGEYILQAIVRDISERKLAERAIRESEERFRMLLQDVQSVSVQGYSMDGTTQYWNKASENLYGYSMQEAIGKNLIDLIVPVEMKGDVWKAISDMLESGQSIPASELTLMKKDGSPVTVYSSHAIVKGPGGVAELFCIDIDLSARKQAEQAIRESEERFRVVVQTANDAVITMDKHGLIVSWNMAAETIFGFSPDEALGMPVSRITPERFRTQQRYGADQPFENTERRLSGKIIEAAGLTKDGREFPFEMSLAEWKTQTDTFYTAFIRDVSERKQADERILQSEKKYRELFQVNKDGIAIFRLDPSGPPSTFVELNDAAPKMLGYTRDEMLKLTPIELEPFTSQTQLQARISEFDLHGGVNFETVLLHKNGHPVYAEFTSQLIQYEDQPAIMNIVRDVSERKQHEIELQAISSLSAVLRSAPSRKEMLPAIVEQLVVLLNCETVSIEIIDPLTGDAVMEAAHGTWAVLTGTSQKSGTGINALISQTRQPYFTNDLKNDPNLVYPEWVNNDIKGCIGAPLIAQDQLIGFAWMGRRSKIVETEVRLFTAVADIAANALHRATLHEQSKKDAAELVLAYDSTLEGWAHALELRDQETEGHTRRVMQMTVDLAKAMGVGEHEIENVRRGALLHDIGKMGIPDSVLLKPGTLNEREWEIMRRHPEYAYNFLEPIEYLRPVLDIPYCHHEKWDGSGYPRGLKGAEIPFVARIFAIVDVWDALHSDRPYRMAWDQEKTRKYIVEQSGTHFDPQVVQAFLELLDGNNESIIV